MEKTKKRDTERAARIKKTSRITGVDVRSVQRVLNGDQENEFVFDVYMAIAEEEEKMENKLIDAVKELIPFK
jgi:hypothetical protein